MSSAAAAAAAAAGGDPGPAPPAAATGLTSFDIPWKKYLFYVLAYCDTFHDFSKPRQVGEGACVNPAWVPNRSKYVLDFIGKMDPDVGKDFKGRYYNTINTMKGTSSESFENAVFKSFTKLTKNPLIDLFPGGIDKPAIMGYLSGLFQMPVGQENQIEHLDERYFSQASPAASLSGLIYLTIPAVVYSQDTQNKILNFFKFGMSGRNRL